MRRYMHRRSRPEMGYALARDIFVAGSITCFLCAIHRIAKALTLSARVDALDEFEDAYTSEERDKVMNGIKKASLHC